MTSRNLTEVFVIMRNNASKNRNHYDDRRGSDAERLLKHSVREAEEGLELQDDYGTPPAWLDKFEEAQYTMSKIKPKLDELGSLHARHLLRPAFDDQRDDECDIEVLSQIVSKLITSTHRHIQCVRSSIGVGSKMEQCLTVNAVHCALLQLQELTVKFRASQNAYLLQLNSREERSQKYFDDGGGAGAGDVFTNVELGEQSAENFVDSFDNFLQPPAEGKSGNGYLFEDDEQAIDDHFQRPPASRMTQQQLLLFEEENTRVAQHREQEVTKIVKSIYDLNDIFKDLGHMVQEQGTVLDRIDYNVEQTQTRVSEGLRQLHKAEMYQRKNRKMCVILVLAAVTFFMLLLLILTKL
uniref:Syntaxin 16 n=3 Tax=Drosophila melanogaster TaxID=7227 RepID=Q9VR90_DROME|nr:syntaxin 16 [Drosophila melanogaster]AAF50914.1 syntaxin 16 [Drosophila melanogaster]|eukprot:NP_523420.1 syntaxin 16 [Drosophila melanogaster]